jgi:hypothetical protein
MIDKNLIDNNKSKSAKILCQIMLEKNVLSLNKVQKVKESDPSASSG